MSGATRLATRNFLSWCARICVPCWRDARVLLVVALLAREILQTGRARRPRRTTAPPFAMPLDDTTAERFDPMMLQMAQQVAAMADGENPINLMLDLYFGFLRRKTDFFSGRRSVPRGGPLRLRAPGGDRPPGQRVEGSVRGERAAKAKAEAEAKAAREAARRRRDAERRTTRVARVRQAELDRKLAEQKLAADGTPKIQEISEEDGDEAGAKGEEDAGGGPRRVDAWDDYAQRRQRRRRDAHSWTQTLQDLDVRVRIPTGTPAKMIACDIKKKHLTFGLKGQPPMIDKGGALRGVGD